MFLYRNLALGGLAALSLFACSGERQTVSGEIVDKCHYQTKTETTIRINKDGSRDTNIVTLDLYVYLIESDGRKTWVGDYAFNDDKKIGEPLTAQVKPKSGKVPTDCKDKGDFPYYKK